MNSRGENICDFLKKHIIYAKTALIAAIPVLYKIILEPAYNGVVGNRADNILLDFLKWLNNKNTITIGIWQLIIFLIISIATLIIVGYIFYS
jgi:hypothetical protein